MQVEVYGAAGHSMWGERSSEKVNIQAANYDEKMVTKATLKHNAIFYQSHHKNADTTTSLRCHSNTEKPKLTFIHSMII